MRFLLLLFIFLNTSLFSSALIQLDTLPIKLENFSISYLNDINAKHTIETIQSQKFQNISNQNAFSGNVGATWYKLQIKNNTPDTKIYLHNDLAYFSKNIEIYTLRDNQEIKKEIFHILDDAGSNKLIGSTLIFSLAIKKDEKLSIYIKNTAMISSLFSLKIYDENSSLNAMTNKTFFSNFIIFILLTLALYNFMLFLFNKRKEFFFYSLYLLNASIGFTYMYGSLFNNLNIYGYLGYWFNLSAILVSLFLGLFVIYTLDTATLNKTIHTFFKSLLILALINVSLAFIIDLTFALEVVKLLFAYSFILMLYLSYYLLKNKHPLALLFSSAYFIYIISMIVSLLAMSNIIEMNFYTLHASGIGMVIEALLFSYLLHHHMKLLEQKIAKQQQIIITKNQKAQMGEMIESITHQWKQPLTGIASTIMLLNFKLDDEEFNKQYFKDKINQIDTSIHFLVDTMEDFKNFFSHKKIQKDCDLNKLIDKAINLSKDDTLINEIIITQELTFSGTIYIFENELLHILLNMIQNSKEAFQDMDTKIEGPRSIHIVGTTKQDETIIDIIDNAGGISQDKLPFIFNQNFTTKDAKNGTGLGLYLSKIIIEDHFNGSIEVKNIPNGTMFRISL